MILDKLRSIKFMRRFLDKREQHRMEVHLERELRLLEEQPVVPDIPKFNSDFTAFEWNGAVYTIPVEYYGMPVNVNTMRCVAMDIVKTQERMIKQLD